MKPHVLKVSKSADKSFSIRKDNIPENSYLHFHPELELVYVLDGEFDLMVNHRIIHIKSKSLCIIGNNVPHMWQVKDNEKANNAVAPNFIVAHIDENFWGENFLNLPEVSSIKGVIEHAKRCIVMEHIAKKIVILLEALFFANGINRIVHLLRILSWVAENVNGNDMLPNPICAPISTSFQNERINRIYAYSLKNFQKKISLEEIANLVNITPTAFCHFFKRNTGKTYYQVLEELRINHSCRLLIETDLASKLISYKCGFNNSTSFHKIFKAVTGKTPLSFKKTFNMSN